MANAAGAWAFNMNTGNLALGNAANAIAANVGSIGCCVPTTTPGG
jgi:hypothetical protein